MKCKVCYHCRKCYYDDNKTNNDIGYLGFEIGYFDPDYYHYWYKEGWMIVSTNHKINIGDEVVGRNKQYNFLKKVNCTNEMAMYLDIAYVQFVRESYTGHPVFKVIDIEPSDDIINKCIKKYEDGEMFIDKYPIIDDPRWCLWWDKKWMTIQLLKHNDHLYKHPRLYSIIKDICIHRTNPIVEKHFHDLDLVYEYKTPKVFEKKVLVHKISEGEMAAKKIKYRNGRHFYSKKY